MVGHCTHGFFFIGFRRLLPLAALLMLSGCMHAPQFPRRVSVAEVVHNARCELYEAVSQNIHDYPWIERWGATFNFSFVVDRHIDASTDTTYLVPIQYGAFTLGIQADLKQNAKGTYVLNFSIPDGLGNFWEADCGRIRSEAQTPRRLLNGEIGLRRWLNDVIPQLEDAWIVPEGEWDTTLTKERRKYAGKATQLSYTIEFGVTADGSLLPSWNLMYPNGHQFRPALDLGVSRIVTHTLIVGMAPIAALPPLDLTGIHTTFDGKDVIMGRRVCVTNIENRSYASSTIRTSDGRWIRPQRNSQKTRARWRRQRHPGKAPKISWLFRGCFRTNRDQANTEAMKNAIANAEQATKHYDNVAAERKVLEARQQTIHAQARAYQAVGREAEAHAMARARQQARQETEQRLQQVIQEQIIRDAFRR